MKRKLSLIVLVAMLAAACLAIFVACKGLDDFSISLLRDKMDAQFSKAVGTGYTLDSVISFTNEQGEEISCHIKWTTDNDKIIISNTADKTDITVPSNVTAYILTGTLVDEKGDFITLDGQIVTVQHAIYAGNAGIVTPPSIDDNPEDPTPQHNHNYQWVDNLDGTHKQHCNVTGCDQPDINAGSHVWGSDNKCTSCSAAKPADENPGDNTGDNNGDDNTGTTESKTLTIDLKGTTTRTAYSADAIVHESNGIKVTNAKASASSSCYDNTSAYAMRCYKNSTVKIECVGMVKIVIECDTHTQQDGTTYYSGFDGMKVDGATITRSENIVTITFSQPTDVFQSGEVTSQVRINEITVTTGTGDNQGTTPPTGGDNTGTTTPPTGDDNTGTNPPPSGGDDDVDVSGALSASQAMAETLSLNLASGKYSANSYKVLAYVVSVATKDLNGSIVYDLGLADTAGGTKAFELYHGNLVSGSSVPAVGDKVLIVGYLTCFTPSSGTPIYQIGGSKDTGFATVQVVTDSTVNPPSTGDNTGTTTPPTGGDNTGDNTGDDNTGTTTPTIPDGAQTETITIATYASANGWEDSATDNSKVYTSVNGTAASITLEVTSPQDPQMTGRFWSGTQWRVYRTEGATIKIEGKTGYTIASVKITYTPNKNGVLIYDGNDIASDTVINVTDNIITLSIGGGDSGKTNGQVFITAIEIVYTPA